MNIFFISDTHFGHKNILEYDKRPFSTIEEHDQTIIDNWNRVVGVNDTIYHLGDFALCSEGRAEEIMKQLNGFKRYIIGNHDSSKMLKRIERHFDVIGRYHEAIIGNQLIVMCHYALGTWNKSHRGSWNLYGHSHGTYPSKGRQIDVGVNCIDYTPIEFKQLELKLGNTAITFSDHHKERE